MNVTALKRKSSDVSAEVVLITPELAKEYLDTNTNNRKIRATKVNQFASDITGGRWIFSPQGISFSVAGVMIDGQHRMLAIIKSRCSIPMWVFRNVDPSVMEVIDTGSTRSLTDRAQISGRFGYVTNAHSATLKKMITGMVGGDGLTITEEMKRLEAHWPAVEFACKHMKKKIPGVATAATRAVVGRAFYSVEHEKLKHFCHVLSTGEMKREGDTIILKLLRFLITKPTHGRRIRNEKYCKTERALDAWLAGEKLSKLCATSFELFPLPEEIEERT